MALGVVGSAAAFFAGLPAKINDFSFGAGQAEPSNRNTKGTVDLPASGEAQDSNPELAGGITNGFSVSEICDLKIWIEDASGNVFTNSDGKAPFGDGSLKVKNTSGSTLKEADFIEDVDGIVTYNLVGCIPVTTSPGAYELQMEHMESEPDTWFIKMAASDKKVSKHYENNGEASVRSDDDTRLFGATPGSTRTGTTVTVVNADTTDSIVSLVVTLITNGTATIVTGSVDDLSGNPISGAAVSVAGDGLSMTISNVSIGNPGGTQIWIDTTVPVSGDSAFRVKAVY